MIDPPDRNRPLPPPEVEPLPDLAWARLERQLWQALDTPLAEPAPRPRFRLGRWRYPVAAAAAIAAAAALALLWPRAPAPASKLGAPAVAVKPSRIATADAATELSFGDAEILVAPRSTLLLGGDDLRGVELFLERGRATFEVAPRSERAPFVVRAGAVRVTVVGTAFTVARDGDEVKVEVQRGTVEIVAAGRRDRVTAGQIWDRDGARAGTLAMLEPAGPSPIPDPIANPIPIPDPTASPIRTPDRSPLRTAPSPAAADPKAAFAAAAALEASDPRAAMLAYRRLATGTDAWAANALYAAARLALDRGDRTGAGHLARSYLVRFPHGANATDARALLDRL